MQTQDVFMPFPAEAAEWDKVMLAIASPYTFVKWCRTRVGRAPNCFVKFPGLCVLGEYLYDVAGVRTSVLRREIYPVNSDLSYVITPKWALRVIDYVDWLGNGATYHDVANMVMTAIQQGEIA